MSPHTVILVLTSLICILHKVCCNSPPLILQYGPYFSKEDNPIGTCIGTVIAQDSDPADQCNLAFAILGEIAISIIELQDSDDCDVKNVCLRQQLDYETLSEYTILLQVSDTANNNVQKLSKIYVEDVNDVLPTFQNLPYRAEVPEDSSLRSFVYKVYATDLDTGANGLVNYFITTPQDLFAINTNNGTVILNDSLDYEVEKFYQLEIMARDGGGLNSTTDLVINVLDVQDTAPFFVNLPYLAEVKEDASVGTSLLAVSALDGDRGVPNPVVYSFLSGNHEYFALNASTGVISVSRALNREDPDVLDLFGVLEMTVLAREDTATPQGPTTATAMVTIRILDVNDQVPTFSQSLYEATVLENTQVRIPVSIIPEGTEISVQDMDQGDNGRFELSVEKDGMAFDVFEVVPKFALNDASLMLRVKNSTGLDYELVKNYTFQIVAREYLTAERHENHTDVTVYLQDINDNWPQFSAQAYNTTLAENSPRNTYVTTITATDEDTGSFGTLAYFLRGASENLFTVDPISGEISVAVAAQSDHTLLDREKQDTHYLTVEAIDGGGLRSSVQLEITLRDENDNAPQIPRAQYDGFVQENQAGLERALVIEATDVDLPPLNDKIQFHIISGDPMGNFSINSDTGEIGIVGPLDYESMDPIQGGVFTLTVMAQDSGTPALNSTVSVMINVEDVNDESPVFESNLYTTLIPENSVGGAYVATITANDNDRTAPNNEVIYRIESGGLDKFRIDAVTGVVSVESGAVLDRDLYEAVYTLSVLAIDRGTPPLSGTSTVRINITDVNNKFPQFLPPQQVAQVLENATVGSTFFTYTATDLDLNHNLRYELLSDRVTGQDEYGNTYDNRTYLASLFSIHESSGAVFVNQSLDRETVELIVVTVFAEDLNAVEPPIQNTTALLYITLLDVNDNPPEWVPSDVFSASISEIASAGDEVKQVTAIDRDMNTGAIKYYEINENEYFVISNANRETGIITLRKSVDHETNKWVNLTVMAVDSGQPTLSSKATVHIEIADVNDHRPEWQVFSGQIEVWENATLETIVSEVYATDLDSGEFGRVMYFIVNGDDGDFIIDNTTGVLTTSDVLDREKRASYSLTIEARDNNLAPINQQSKTPGYMTVTILDINDNAPMFEHTSYHASIQENAKLNDPLITVHATDPDAGDNGAILYTIDAAPGNASVLFGIEPDSGQIFVLADLGGFHGYFFLQARATDKGNPALSNVTTVFVFIEDVNDNAPVISTPRENETLYLPENVEIGYHLIKVVASDADEGLNGQMVYEFVTTASSRQDYKYFTIDPDLGDIYTALHIDREQQQFYYLEVVVKDRGTPQMEDRRTITVEAMDQDDNPPTFDRTQIPPPHRVHVEEEHSGVQVASLDLASDPDVGNNSIICYYIVGGDEEKSAFYMNRTTGDLWLHQSLDRETIAKVMLVIKASEDCWSNFYYREENTRQPWNESDLSTLLVQVEVIDINDNPPHLTRKWFTAGVTKDTQFEHQVLNITSYTRDPDTGENSLLAYHIEPPFQLSPQLQGKFDRDPFTIGLRDGVVRTNVFFESDMEGHIEFVVYVNDTVAEHFDRANVSIYLLNENQRVKIVIRGEPEEVNQFKDLFADFLSNVTNVIINVDEILTHKDASGKPDPRKTDMFIHGIDPVTGDVIESDVLIDLIDKNYIYLSDLFKTYNVIKVVPAIETDGGGSTDKNLLYGVVAMAVVLACLIVIICTTFWMCRRKVEVNPSGSVQWDRIGIYVLASVTGILLVILIIVVLTICYRTRLYKRKLKAATAMAFGSHDKGLNHLHMPGTNHHAYEGSNPIWLEQYENGWPRETDTDSKNSLDENTFTPDDGSGGGDASSRGYDEQQMNVEMENDEFDQYNKAIGGAGSTANILDPDMYLRAALEGNKKQAPVPPTQSRGSNNTNNTNNVDGLSNSSNRTNNHSTSLNNEDADVNSQHHKHENGGKSIPNGMTPNGAHPRHYSLTPANTKTASIGRKSNTSANSRRQSNIDSQQHRNISDIVGQTAVVGPYDNRGYELQATEI